MKRTPPEFPPPAPPSHRSKKTRELPNLSDCHCCKARINYSNPKNRLQALTSEWRIVLLCKSCYNLVESSQFCSYCLTSVNSSSIDSFYECRRCRRRVHKDCVSKFAFNSGNSEEFSVCFDCWIPKLLENDYNRSVRVVRSSGGGNNSSDKKKVEKNGGEMPSLASSGVCNDLLVKKKRKRLEEINVDVVVALVAAEAKEKAVGKALAAKKAVDFARGALEIVRVDKGGGEDGGKAVEEDVELAIRLHRAMNSSPRISGDLCLLNTHCVNVPKLEDNVDGLELPGVNGASCSSKGTDVGGIANGERNRLCSIQAREECGKMRCRKRGEMRNGDSDGCFITYIRKGRSSMSVKCKEEPDCPLRVYSKKPAQQRVERHHVDPGHCSKTYSRRLSNCKSKVPNGSCNVDNGTLAPAIASNGCEESRVQTNDS